MSPLESSTSFNSPSSSSSTSAAPTHRVLSLYYPEITTLSSLFTPKDNLLKEKDPERFKTLLDECLVGCTEPNGLSKGEWKVLEKEDRLVGMSEILNQVLQRIFNVHAKEYEILRSQGLPAYTTPKNVLAAGKRLNRFGMNNETVRVGSGASFEIVSTNTIASSITSSKDWSTLLARVGPDSIIKLLSSPKIALFQPLQNGCYVQISGTMISELKVYAAKDGKKKERSKDGGGRKTHVRAVKKRGKKKKKKVEQKTEEDEEGEEEKIDGGDGEETRREEPVEKDAMDLDLPQAGPPSIDEPPQAQATSKVRALGPSRSAPSLLVASDRPPPARGTQIAQAQPLQAPARTHHSHNSIVFSRFRIYHARLSKTGGKINYGLSPKHILSRLGQNFTLPTSAQLPPPAPSSTSSARTTKTLIPTLQSLSHLYSPSRHLSKYVFPRQYSLDNVFEGAKVNTNMRVRPDHEDREQEIKIFGTVKTPMRLKKTVLPLLNRMIVLHGRCNYRKLLGVKCPSKVTHRELDDAEKKSLVTDLMSEPPATQLSRTNAAAFPPSSASARTNSQLALADTSIVTTASSSGRIPDSQVDEETRVDLDQMDCELEPTPSLRPVKIKAGLEKKPKLAEFACTPYEVESYIQAVVRDVIPRAFWGSDRNAKLVMKHISRFLRMRRFESISLHSLLQGFSILDCEWLDPAVSIFSPDKIDERGTPTVKSKSIDAVEMERRKELLAEFLHWVFDSFVTDLVRTAFYVTDSATHQNRPLFFRQDDWQALTAPLLESLGQTVFERVPDNQVIALERRPRELPFSYVRLLPKEAGVRPIVNLARRPLKLGMNGAKEVGMPINKILAGVFDVLTFESKRKPELVGSLVSNPHEIYAKLKEYKTRLLESDGSETGELPELYFVKVDVKSCFDTIKQDKLLALVEVILSETLYYIQNYSQVVAYSGKSSRQFKSQACGDDDLGSFKELAMRLAENLHDVVLADQVRCSDVHRDKLMVLLEEHITTNLVKVNGHLYRQKDGIPQGSILSSLLCSLFYGDMEKNCLGFTKDVKSLLMRYVDDFMFVTMKKHLAVRFLQIMHNGIPEYGCFVSTEKRLTNFDVSLDDGEVVPPLADGEDFGYCGLAINPKTLEIKMNLRAQMSKEIVDQLTVQRFRKPGEAFLNAMLRAVKVRAHSMYTDTNFNSKSTVYLNIYQAMLVVALKYQAYVQEWCGSLKGKVTFLWNALQKIVKNEYSTLFAQSRSRKAITLSASFELDRLHVIWLGFHAFHRVLSRHSATFSPLVRLLLVEIKTPRVRRHLPTLKKIVDDESNRFVDKTTKGRRR
ncbi:hypothetical protein JCM3765_002979 [Sporobolomyces pararoseus]